MAARGPGDRLRVGFDREHLVFAPGETFQFEIEPHLLEASARESAIRPKCWPAPAALQLWARDYEAGDEGTSTSISIKVPDAEGVYDLSIAAVQSTRRRQLRPKKASLTERRVQLVVVDDRPPAPAGGRATPVKVVEINPVNSRWWDRLGAIPLVPALRKGPLGNGDSATWEHPKLGPMIQLGPGGASPNISWEAYPLPINNPGQPHILDIEYPSDVPQTMGISLIEPNAAGAVLPIGLDSGVYVSDEEAENPAQLAHHRIVFWPRTDTPLLLVTNRRAGSRAVYGKITVYGAGHSQFAFRALGRSESGDLLPPAVGETDGEGRLLAGYLDRPLFVENFSAPKCSTP